MIQLAALGDQTSVSSASRLLPPTFVEVQAQVTPFDGLPHPFSSSTQQLELAISFSFDGGLTFPESVSMTTEGSPTGVWGNSPFPRLKRGTDARDPNGNAPTHYTVSVSTAAGSVSFGVNLVEG